MEGLSQLLIGKDPTRVEHLWQMMWRQHFWHGSGMARALFGQLASLASTSRCGTSRQGPQRAVSQALARSRSRLHARPSPAMGMQIARALDPYGLYVLEEPCWPESIEGLAAINAAVTTPIATGERMTHLAAFRDLFAARDCEICQLDITHCGGFTEARRVAAMADSYRIALVPHNPLGPGEYRCFD